MTCCFDIGGSFIRYGTPDAEGLVPERGRIPTPGKDFAGFVHALSDALADMPGGDGDVVSISLAGFTDVQTGRAVVANVPCLNGRSLEKELSGRLGRQVCITNDADCFALAEAQRGAGKGHSSVFAIILGTGVGGGLVINGELVRGAGGISGEWGHGPIVDPGAGGLIDPLPRVQCGCGRMDCLDTVGGARGLERLHAALHDETRNSADIIDAWQAQEEPAGLTIKVYVEHLARALSVVLNTIGASVVPVGGGMAAVPQLVAALDMRVRELVLARHGSPLVVPGKRARDGGLVGAAVVARAEGGVAA